MATKLRLGVMTQSEDPANTKAMLQHLSNTIDLVSPGGIATPLQYMGSGLFKAKITGMVLSDNVVFLYNLVYKDATITSESDGCVFSCDIEKMKQYIMVAQEAVYTQYLSNSGAASRVSTKPKPRHTRFSFRTYIAIAMFLILVTVLIGDKVDAGIIKRWIQQ